MDKRDIVEQLQDACDLATDKRELERLCGNAKIEIERLRKDSERLEWLMRNVSGEEFRRLGVTYGGNCGRDRIDAAMLPE